MASKFLKKKILKKYKSGGLLKSQIADDPKLAGGGYVMEDVLKKENYPKKAQGGYVKTPGASTASKNCPKKAEGGEIKKYRGELKSEIKGMGPEGKAYLRDELKGKKYEGKLKGKYKGDLDKELYGMHKKGKKYMKNLLDQYDREGYKGQAHRLRESLKKKEAKEDFKKKSAGKKSPHVKGNKMDIHSLGQIIESKVLKRKLREKEGIPKKNIVGKAEGGWIQGAVKKPGALRAVAKKDKLIKGDEKLSASDLKTLSSKAKKSGNSLLAKRVSLAKTFAKMRKK